MSRSSSEPGPAAGRPRGLCASVSRLPRGGGALRVGDSGHQAGEQRAGRCSRDVRGPRGGGRVRFPEGGQRAPSQREGFARIDLRRP